MRLAASPRSALPSKKAVTSSIPSMNTKLRTRENWLARAWTSWRVKRAKLATDPEMSAMTMISGLDGWGRPGSIPAWRLTAAAAKARRASGSRMARISMAASSSGEASPPAPPPGIIPGIGAPPPGRPPAPSAPSSSPSKANGWRAKYTSKRMLKTFSWSACLTSVVCSAVLNVARSSMGMCSSARMASRFSVIDTGNPAARSSWTKPDSRSSMRPGAGTSTVVTSGLRDLELLVGPLDVALVLEEDVDGAADHVGCDLLHPEMHEGAGPVDRLGDRRRLLQVEGPDGAHDPGDLVGEPGVDPRHPDPHDVLLPLGVGVVEVEEQAAPLQRLRQLPGVVGGEDHDRAPHGRDRAQLRHRHLEVGQHLEEQGLGLDLDPVDLVDEEHHGLVGPDGLQQGPSEQEGFGEDVGLDRRPVPLVLPVGLDAQQLLLVVPLVEGLRLVEALVALEPDEPGAGRGGDGLGQLGLAHAGRAFDEYGLLQPVGQEDDAGGGGVGQVVDRPELFLDGVDGDEALSHGWFRLSRVRTAWV